MTEDTNITMAGKPFRDKLKDDDENCVICTELNTKPWEMTFGHTFCQNCIQEFWKVKPMCPACGSIQEVIQGDQPPGTMKRKFGYPDEGYFDRVLDELKIKEVTEEDL